MTPKPKVEWVQVHTSHLKDIRRVMSSVRSLSSLSKTRFTCCRGNTLRMQKVHKASLRSVCLFGLSIASPPPDLCMCECVHVHSACVAVHKQRNQTWSGSAQLIVYKNDWSLYLVNTYS